MRYTDLSKECTHPGCEGNSAFTLLGPVSVARALERGSICVLTITCSGWMDGWRRRGSGGEEDSGGLTPLTPS